MIDFAAGIADHQRVIARLAPLLPELETIARRMQTCLVDGGKILFMGNGGSAADAQHLASELLGRFTRERRGLAAIALTTDSSALTAIGNDIGFDAIFARQIEGLCRPGDMVFGISTSGNSPNVVQGLSRARELDAVTVGMTGEGGGQLKALADHCLMVPSPVVARIQEAHILLGHLLCDWVEAGVAG